MTLLDLALPAQETASWNTSSNGSLILTSCDEALSNCTSNISIFTPETSAEFRIPDPPYPPWSTGILASMAAVTSFFTTVGNILVVVAFVLEKNLRQPSNFLIASLAVTDILIGMFSMPFYSLYLLMNYWPLGQVVCDLWLSLDYTVCLVSQYTVFLITLDRFCSVTSPARYRNWRTKAKIKIMIAVTWLVPAFIFFTSILGWRTFTDSLPPMDFSCAVEFQKNPLFTVILVICYYWVTLVIMIGMYICIYKVALSLHTKSKAKSKRMRQMRHLTAANNNNIGTRETVALGSRNGQVEKMSDYKKPTSRKTQRVVEEDVSDLSNDLSSNEVSYSKKYDSPKLATHAANGGTLQDDSTTELQHSPVWKPRSSLPTDSIRWTALSGERFHNVAEGNELISNEGMESLEQHSSNVTQESLEEQPANKLLFQIAKIFARIRKANPCKDSPATDSPKIKSKSANRARKALRTITLILGAFVICWTPYHIVVIVYAYCHDCVNITFYNFTYWLCYMNSPLNPFAYALSNQQFKVAFIKIFKGDYLRKNKSRLK